MDSKEDKDLGERVLMNFCVPYMMNKQPMSKHIRLEHQKNP